MCTIRKTFTSRLDLWLNPILDAATSGSDFDLRALRKRPISIYVGVNPDDLHRLRPVLNLCFQLAIGLQTRELPERNPALKHQVLMLLDEFTALGRIPIIAEAISYLPGYNVRVVLVIQTPAQLREELRHHEHVHRRERDPRRGSNVEARFGGAGPRGGRSGQDQGDQGNHSRAEPHHTPPRLEPPRAPSGLGPQ